MTKDVTTKSATPINKRSVNNLNQFTYKFDYRSSITPRKKVKFLKALAKSANVTIAADSVKISRRTLYDHYKNDLEFAQAWDEALAIAVDRLEHRAHQRAFDGTDKPLTYKGEITRDKDGQPVTIKEYSDTLTIFLLKAHRPEKYRDNTNVNVSGTLTLEALVGAAVAPALPTVEAGPVIEHEQDSQE